MLLFTFKDRLKLIHTSAGDHVLLLVAVRSLKSLDSNNPVVKIFQYLVVSRGLVVTLTGKHAFIKPVLKLTTFTWSGY